MFSTKIFPQKLATGSNFCDREIERALLKSYMLGVRPTLIISPRRYGKTSLGMYVLNGLNLPYIHLDLFQCLSTADMETLILGGIGELLASLESTPKKAIKAVSEFFGALSVAFSIVQAKVEVSFTRGQIRKKMLLNALKNLDLILEKKKKSAVIFLDEFQRLEQMDSPEEIEGAIRFVAQQSKNLIFLFSGSNRHLLSKMFDEKNRPLYKLCERIQLERIPAKEYIPFLQKQAKKNWKKTLDVSAVDAIFECTKCHPFYVNALCFRLWARTTLFKEKDVYACWHDFISGEKSSVFNTLEGLSGNQFKLLVCLARTGEIESLNDEFLASSKMASSSAQQALKVLMKKDYIEIYKGKYRVLDPLIESLLASG